MSDEWLARLDEKRGPVPRGSFVKGMVMQALGFDVKWPVRKSPSPVEHMVAHRDFAKAAVREFVADEQSDRVEHDAKALKSSVVDRNRKKAEGSRPGVNKDGRVVPSYDDGGEYKPIPKIAPRR